MKRISKCILLLIFSILTTSAISQGINFQGVARSANGTILASQKISLKLSIITGTATTSPDYVETRSVSTNAQGIFSIVIGDTGAISTIGTYASISWKTSSKFLKVEMDPNNGTGFISMGTTPLQYVPFSYYSNGVDAANIAGVLPVKSGGTGVTIISDLKIAMTLDNVNNTTDLTKPISTLTQSALDLKLNKADTSKYTKQTYTDSALLTKLSITGNAATATIATTATTAGTATTAIKLATPRNINGVAFDGSGDIVVTADAGTLTGTLLKSTVTGSSLTSVGTLSAGSVPYSLLSGTVPTWNQNTTGNAATATTAGNITATNNTSLTSLSNLATVGTITSGVWSGTTVAVAKGGTGLISSGTNGQVLTSTGSGTLTWTGTHYIGESYGGGIVFYVYDNGKHGLIAATSDQSTGIRWYGGSNTNTRARADGVGAGLKNTALIIANQGAVDGNAFAATVCNEYSVTVDGVTYGDWYLPSKHELNLLYLQKSVVGGFADAFYWSSTESVSVNAYVQVFPFGDQGSNSKNTTTNYVRAVRAF